MTLFVNDYENDNVMINLIIKNIMQNSSEDGKYLKKKTYDHT